MRSTSWSSTAPPDKAADAAALGRRRGRVGSIDDVAAADIVVNATSVGMGTAELPARRRRCCDRARSSPTSCTTRCETALLAAARAAGCTPVDGLGMLVHQAVLQQVIWTGTRPDPAVMRAAAEPAASCRRRQ